MPHHNRRLTVTAPYVKVIAPPDDLDQIAQDACRTVYANCKHVPLRALADQTAKYISKRHQVSFPDAHRACAKWMILEATIQEAYTPRQRDRLRASSWMQRQMDLHDEYLQHVARLLK